MNPHFFPQRLLELEAFSDRFNARRIQSDLVDIYFASYPAGTVITAHTHDTDNYGVITKGMLILEVDGIETTYRAGDWYHVPAHAEHAARFEEDTAEIELWFATNSASNREKD